MGSLQMSCVLTVGLCGQLLPVTYVYLPKSARAYLFPQSVKIHYFCSGPFSVDPICPQPRYFPSTLTTLTWSTTPPPTRSGSAGHNNNNNNNNDDNDNNNNNDNDNNSNNDYNSNSNSHSDKHTD